MASALFNKATGIRYATVAKDAPLPVGQRPTEESRRAHFNLLASSDLGAKNAGNALVAAFRRAHA